MNVKKNTKFKKSQVNKLICCFFYVFICLFCSSHNLFAQLVLDGAYVNISGGTNASKIYIVIGESATSGITQRVTGGHIYTEGQYDFVQWNIGSGTGDYIFPFGHSNIAYIPFTFKKTSSGSSNVWASTWNTSQQNILHPGVSDVVACWIMKGQGDSLSTALDRFWDVRTSASTTADLTFSYRAEENTTALPIDQLKMQRWTGSACSPWTAPAGPGNNLGVTTGVGIVGPVTGQTVFTPFVLVRTAAPLLQPVSANAGINKSIFFGSSTAIGGSPTATGGISPYTYGWTPTANLTSPTVANPVANPISTTNYNVTVTDVRGCSATDGMVLTVNPVNAYAIPKKKLDGGFYEAINGLIYFKFNEEYLGGTMQFKVYNSDRDVVISNTVNSSTINSTTKVLGDNRYVINCNCFLSTGYYILEIINDKKEVIKLRFHYVVPTPNNC